MKVAAIVFAGYLVGLPVLGWWLYDLRRFHRPLWVGVGNRRVWQTAAIVAYLCAGWPVLVLALGWRTSVTRRELIVELNLFRDYQASAGPSR